MGIKGFLTTLGLGVGAMYFLDPDRGDRRRADVRDQVMKLRSEAQSVWSEGSEDLAQRFKGVGQRAEDMAQDATRGGMDALGGQINGMKFKLDMNRPGDRLLTMGGGGLLALFGLTRGGILGKAAMLTGLNFLVQALSRKNYMGDLLTKMKSEGGGAGIEFRKGIRIEAPVEQVHAFWQDYDNFPRFMSHLKEVRDMGNGKSHWVAKGPADVPVEWDAQITEHIPNRVIAWESLPGSEVYNAGRVRFEPVAGATRVDVFMTYNPPGGVAGQAIASLFGVDPKSAMDEDLLRLKSLLEEGRPQQGGGEGMGEERYRPASGMTTTASRRRQGTRATSGGDSGTDALASDASIDSETTGFPGEGTPPERKPGSDIAGAGS
jgi:uncharacterized membrane protein